MIFNLTVIGKNTGSNWMTAIDGNTVSSEYYQVYTSGAYSTSSPVNFTFKMQYHLPAPLM